MEVKTYRLRNLKTGLFYKNLMSTRGIKKNGMPKQSGPLIHHMNDSSEGTYMFKGHLISDLNWIIAAGMGETLNDYEILAYSRQPTKTTYKLATVKKRIEAEFIMKKLSKQ